MKPQLIRAGSDALSRSAKPPRAIVEACEPRRLLSTVIVNSAAYQANPTGSGLVSLSDALLFSKTDTTPTVITFSPAVFSTPQTITLGGSPIIFDASTNPVTIVGSTAGVTISGGYAFSSIFQVNAGATVSLSSLTMISATPIGAGGAINNSGDLTVTGCTIYGTSSGAFGTIGVAGSGGGIFSDGTLTLINSTLVVDGATNPFNLSGGGNGGGLFNSGDATLINDTITGNGASSGGGIFNAGTLNIGNTIVYANSAAIGPDVSGTVHSLGHNLIGNTDGSDGWVASDITGTGVHPVDAFVDGLADNGGPVQTCLPLLGSSAIDGGSVDLIPPGTTTDQRGFARTRGSKVDIGSVELVDPAAGKRGARTTLVADPASYDKNQSVKLTATVVSAGVQVPVTGNVVFAVNGETVGKVKLGSDGVATLRLDSFASPYNQITATYSGSATLASGLPAEITVDENDVLTGIVTTLVSSSLPKSFILGQPLKAKVAIRLQNQLATNQTTAFSVGLYLAPSDTPDFRSATAITSTNTTPQIKSHKAIKTRFLIDSLPYQLLAGSYHLLVHVTDSTGLSDTLDTGRVIILRDPVITLSAVFSNSQTLLKKNATSKSITAALKKGLNLLVSTAGNVSDKTSLSAVVGFSTDAAGRNGVSSIDGAVSGFRFQLKPGRRVRVHVSGWADIYSALPAGNYFLTVTLSDDQANSATATRPL